MLSSCTRQHEQVGAYLSGSDSEVSDSEADSELTKILLGAIVVPHSYISQKCPRKAVPSVLIRIVLHTSERAKKE
jgi:hypothetical protein